MSRCTVRVASPSREQAELLGKARRAESGAVDRLSAASPCRYGT
jgi:hypothetical protein